jgi:hypothetical protein
MRKKIDYYETAMKKIGGRRQGGGCKLRLAKPKQELVCRFG